MPMMALVNPVYDCLFRLAHPDSLSKEEEVGDRVQIAVEGAGPWLSSEYQPAVHGGVRAHHFPGQEPGGAIQGLSQYQDKLPGLEFIQNREQPKPTGSEAFFPVGKPTCDRNLAVDTDGPETQSGRGGKVGLSGSLETGPASSLGHQTLGKS